MSVSGASSTSSGRRESAAARSREATRERLLASGVRLFAKRGLNGVTTHDIAREAGVAAGTFYLHFPDKGALFHEIAVHTEERMRQRLDDAVEGTELLGDSVRAQVTALADFAADNRDLMRILFSADSGPEGLALLDSFSSSIAEGRREEIEAGEMPSALDADVVSHAMVGMFRRVLLWWIQDPEPVSRETLIESLTRIQLFGTHPE